MTNYEIRWQNQEMWENGEWGTYYYDTWQAAVHEAWYMKNDSNCVTVELHEIHIITFKDDGREKEEEKEEKEEKTTNYKNDDVQSIEDIYERVPKNWARIIENHLKDEHIKGYEDGYEYGYDVAEMENNENNWY